MTRRKHRVVVEITFPRKVSQKFAAHFVQDVLDRSTTYPDRIACKQYDKVTRGEQQRDATRRRQRRIVRERGDGHNLH